MERRMSKNVVEGKIYAAFSDRDMKDLLGDLERAKSSLELAYLMYLDIEQRRRDKANSDTLAQHGMILGVLQAQSSGQNAVVSQLMLILQSLTLPQQSIASVSDDFILNSSESRSRGPALDHTESKDGHKYIHQAGRAPKTKQFKRNNSRTRLRASFRLLTWLCSRVWEAAMTTTQCGWSVYLRTFCLVPDGSPIFQSCEHGDLAQVQGLIQNGEASLLDVVLGLGWGRMTLVEVSSQ